MTRLFFCSIDGNPRRVFKSEALAKEWQLDNGSIASLAFVNEIVYNENKEIIEIDGWEFIEFLEQFEEPNTEEFDGTKAYFEERFRFTELTDD